MGSNWQQCMFLIVKPWYEPCNDGRGETQTGMDYDCAHTDSRAPYRYCGVCPANPFILSDPDDIEGNDIQERLKGYVE